MYVGGMAVYSILLWSRDVSWDVCVTWDSQDTWTGGGGGGGGGGMAVYCIVL